MAEKPVELPLADGLLRGHSGGEGPAALVLHGGPAVPDYMEGCARELTSFFATIRYTQRGTAPSTVGPPYSIESHMDDALAVLDAFGIERAWAIGHSWGGHLALHLLIAHPERLLGIVCIDPLGAYGEIFEEFGENMRRGLSRDEVARLDEVEARRRRGETNEADLLDRFSIVWPRYFADPRRAAPVPTRTGPQCSETNRSLAEHFERGTLVNALPHEAPRAAPSRPAERRS